MVASDILAWLTSSPFKLLAVLVAAIALYMLVRASTIRIHENEVGIVIKKFALNPFVRPLQTHRLVALRGEPGVQAGTLTPGSYIGYWPWMYVVRKVNLVKIPPGQLGLVVAKDGKPIPPEQLLGKTVACDNFQDGRTFLEAGGQKGQQLDILLPGEYSINTELFTIITSENAVQYKIDPKLLQVYTVDSDKVGIVTTKDGRDMPRGSIAGPIIEGHNSFQNAQRFIDNGGVKGLQEEVLLEGSWNLNPWFVSIEQVPMLHIHAGTVGIVVSHVGKEHNGSWRNDLGDEQRLVERGEKGIWKTPLGPGSYAFNTRVMVVHIIPTHQITLDWSDKEKPPSNYDAQLKALNLRSKDGFSFNIEVTQVFHIREEDAPRMLYKVGSPYSKVLEPSSGKFDAVRNLVIRVLEPMIGNHFRNSAQDQEMRKFHSERILRQEEATEHIKAALSAFGVQADGTFINHIDLDDSLEKQLNEQAIAQEEQTTYQAKLERETLRRRLVLEETVTIEQKRQIEEENRANIERMKAQKQSENEADAIRRRGEAEAENARRIGEAEAANIQGLVQSLGLEGYLRKLEIEKRGEWSVPGYVSVSSGTNATSVPNLTDLGLISFLTSNATNHMLESLPIKTDIVNRAPIDDLPADQKD